MTPQIIISRVPAELPPMPIDPAWVLEGAPSARGTVLTQSKDKLVSSGFWSCTAGAFKWVFAWDEFVHILEGEVTIREEGSSLTTDCAATGAARFTLMATGSADGCRDSASRVRCA